LTVLRWGGSALNQDLSSPKAPGTRLAINRAIFLGGALLLVACDSDEPGHASSGASESAGTAFSLVRIRHAPPKATTGRDAARDHQPNSRIFF